MPHHRTIAPLLALTLGAAVAAAPGLTAAQRAASQTAPLRLDVMQKRSYPGSAITLRQTLRPGSNYRRYVVSYQSDGLRINALLTVPSGTPPQGGWPAIVFNHGYIPPQQYRTTERYVAYQDALARAGYVTLKSDYRGHGSSEGEAVGGYWSPGYTDDVLNAAASLRQYPGVNPDKLGMWAHSMGGQLTLRAMLIDGRLKAADIWGGVVAPYPDILSKWTRRAGAEPPPPGARRQRAEFQARYGTPQSNPDFYAAISPNSYLKDLNGRPVQLQHSTTDEEVPLAFSQTLATELKAAGQPVTLYTYPGDNHNVSANLGTALRRSVAFFDKYLK